MEVTSAIGYMRLVARRISRRDLSRASEVQDWTLRADVKGNFAEFRNQ
jgi:hypothetical protein